MSKRTGTHGDLDPFQAEVARIALAATETWSFALAGGNALVAHGMLARPTQDIDLFTTTQGGPGEAAGVVTDALQAAGLAVVCEVSADGEFARLRVSDAAASVAKLRASLASWPRDPTQDDEAARAHHAVHNPPPA